MNYTTDFLLDRLYDNLNVDTDKKLSLERPQTKMQNKRTHITNFMKLVQDMKRDKDDIITYFKQELLTDDINLSSDGSLSIKGMYKQGNIESIFKIGRASCRE